MMPSSLVHPENSKLFDNSDSPSSMTECSTSLAGSSTTASSPTSTTAPLTLSPRLNIQNSTSKCYNAITNICLSLLSKIALIFSVKKKHLTGPATENHCELGCTNASGDMFLHKNSFDIPYYQQSATRKLAFGGGLPTATAFPTIQDEKKAKHLSDFYNNSTLSNIAKLFSACVILSAVVMLIRRVLDWDWPYGPEY